MTSTATSVTVAAGPPHTRGRSPEITNDTERRTPNALEYITYSYGRVLPASMRDWVRNDLTGKGATTRTMIRVTIPALLVLAPFWLIPTTWDVHASMTLPIFIPFVLFAHALNKVWRRHRLLQHGLDPDLVDELARKRDAHIHRAYIERYGPRPK
jgi:hypothetical protein